MFTQMLWSNATAVGCGATSFLKDGFYWFGFVCNYATGNIEGLPVYDSSTTAGSGCINGTDATYKSLCSDKEKLNPNYLPGSENSEASNFTGKNYCSILSCGSSHVGCNATDVSFSIIYFISTLSNPWNLFSPIIIHRNCHHHVQVTRAFIDSMLRINSWL